MSCVPVQQRTGTNFTTGNKQQWKKKIENSPYNLSRCIWRQRAPWWAYLSSIALFRNFPNRCLGRNRTGRCRAWSACPSWELAPASIYPFPIPESILQYRIASENQKNALAADRTRRNSGLFSTRVSGRDSGSRQLIPLPPLWGDICSDRRLIEICGRRGPEGKDKWCWQGGFWVGQGG